MPPPKGQLQILAQAVLLQAGQEFGPGQPGLRSVSGWGGGGEA